MKTIWLFIFILSSNISYAQYLRDANIYEGILANLYINHQPSAKGEAMGKGLVANSDGSYGSYFNPALTNLSKGLNFDYSYSQSEGVKPSLNYYGISYSNEKFGSIGVSAYYFSKPLDDNPGFVEQRKHSYYDAIFTVNYSKEVIKDFYAGVNLGVYHFYQYYYWLTANNPGGNFFIADGVTLDLGLLKKFTLKTSANEQIFQLAASVTNFTNSKVVSDEGGFVNKEALPVTFRIGGSHQLKIPDGVIKGVPYPVQFFTHFEYEKIINSEYYGTFKIGEELSLWAILYLRAGYFNSKMEGNDGYFIGEFTYGAGLSIPVNKLLKTKNELTLKIDYVGLNLKDYRRYDYNDYSDYNTLALSLNYIP